jgi:TolB-like protein
MLCTFLTLLLGSPAFGANEARTVLVSYFDNTSQDKTLDPLSKGLADMLITDLSVVPSLRIVERAKLESILNELKLQRTEYFDPGTAQKLGKGLGAQYVFTGSYLLVGEKLRIDVRLVRVDSGEIVAADQAVGERVDFFDIEKELVDVLVRSLDVKLERAEIRALSERPTNSFEAISAYSEGLDAKDHGEDEAAAKAFAKAVAADPSYRAARTASERVAATSRVGQEMLMKSAQDNTAGLDPKDPDLFVKVANLLAASVGGDMASIRTYEGLLSFMIDNRIHPKMVGPGYVLYLETSYMIAWPGRAVNGAKKADDCDKIARVMDYALVNNGPDAATATIPAYLKICSDNVAKGLAFWEAVRERDPKMAQINDAYMAAVERLVVRIDLAQKHR